MRFESSLTVSSSQGLKSAYVNEMYTLFVRLKARILLTIRVSRPSPCTQ